MLTYKIQYNFKVFHKLPNISNMVCMLYPVFEEILGFQQISLQFMRYFRIFKIFHLQIISF